MKYFTHIGVEFSHILYRYKHIKLLPFIDAGQYIPTVVYTSSHIKDINLEKESLVEIIMIPIESSIFKINIYRLDKTTTHLLKDNVRI
tara:strand:+ start:1021 stop:1284 length:264 start_codon:yes stop_codon:yes gene_type:complete